MYRNHQEPHEIPICLFVDFDISRAWRLLKAMLVWSDASCGELSELTLPERNKQRALRWNNGIATLLGFSIFFVVWGTKNASIFHSPLELMMSGAIPWFPFTGATEVAPLVDVGFMGGFEVPTGEWWWWSLTFGQNRKAIWRMMMVHDWCLDPP